MTKECIALEWYECEQAIYVGARREAEVFRFPEHAKKQYSEEPSILNHIESAGAERAVAKRLNLDWHAAINTFKQGVSDVGGAIEVRWRRDKPGKKRDLIVRDDDHDDRFYVLVRGAMPVYEMIGWIRGKDAKQARFRSNPGGHEEAWFVPEEQLRPVSELQVSKVHLADNREDWNF